MASLGDSIFHGQAAGGTCFTCHGVDANGTVLAPPLLVPKKWLTGDGTYAFIQERVTKGMPTPTPPYSAAMPPMGGAHLTPAQIQAVAAYVYSLTHA
jgi:mono/diheme cytochrome c family protein